MSVIESDKRASADLDSTVVEGECIIFDPWLVDLDDPPLETGAYIVSDEWETRGGMR